MDFSNGQLRRVQNSKPPLFSSRDQKSFRSESTNKPPRTRTASFSSMTETRAVSVSPSRGMIPLNLVSTSNVNIPIDLQKKLVSSAGKRKVLAGILKLTNEGFKIPQMTENSIMSSKASLRTIGSKDQLRTMPLKDCTFGQGNKENNYVNIYYKQKQLREQLKAQDSVLECIGRIKDVEGSGKEVSEMDSCELEKRYKKITKDLDKISKNIQLAINKCS